MKPNGSVVRNNGGTIVKAGAATSTFTPLPLVDLAQDRNTAPMTAREGDDVTTAGEATFAYQPLSGENFLLRMAGPNAEKINGSSSTILAVGGMVNEYDCDGIMELNSTRDASGNLVAFGDDNAAGPVIPSRSVPGQLVYRTGAKAPASDVYKAKDSAE